VANVKVCPTCGRENPATAFRCAGCGVNVFGVAPVERSEAAAVALSTAAPSRTCPTCEQTYREDATHCDYCGASLRETTSGAPWTARLVFPFGSVEVLERLAIGREFLFSPLARQLREATNPMSESGGFPSVSRRHAEVYCSAESVYVRDQGSKFGTFVDGVKLEPTVAVRVGHGTVIRFGQHLLVRIEIFS
jgi:hypothetical protein